RSAGAYERLVERLLASPHYGERWARWWLDVARYADSNGYSIDAPRQMWKYRDWVIDALNHDMPFDQFTVEQIAGDMLPDATTAQKIATGFHRNTLMNQEDGVDPDEHRWDNIVDRVATTSTVWLGTTLACAQCHNHKYDPFSQKEFYKFFAFYDSTDYVITGAAHTQRFVEPVLDLPTPEQEARRGELQAEIAALETVLKTQTPELDAAQAEWERAQLAEGANWAVLDPAEFKSTGGARLAKLDDKSLLATGPNPESDVYVITARTDLKGIRAVRVEGLPDPRLPQGGPGRDPYGNFLLTGIEVAAGGQRIELGHAGVDDSAFRFDGKMFFKEEAYAGVKDMPKGWSIDATRDAKRLARQGVFIFARPLGGGAGTVLTVKIKHQGGVLGQGIGRLRLSVTAGEEPLRVVSLPAKARPLLETPASERTPAQREELAAQFRLLAPALKPARDRLADLRLALKELGIVTALILQERPSNERPSTDLRERGSFLSKGEKVYAGTPAALHPFPESQPYNRLGLARWLVDGNNPLVARVTVNRFWEQIFGRGIVETSEDFGSQSAPPSHPELLDYLATEFVGQKWSVKRMHRLIVTSAAYRQSSDASAALLEKDPYNRLLGRGPRFRMEAEMVRDVALAAAGLLSPKVGGPSVFPPQPEGIWRNPYSDDKWKASEGEDRYRRGLYTFLRRTSPYPGFLTFDATSREVCVVRRVRTNTPLQALTTLNDEAFFEAARALARRMLREGPAETRGRIALGFRLCATRAPQPAEADRLAALYKQQLAYYRTRAREATQITQGEPSAKLAAWTLVANVLLNLDETLTKR
ncbi:MAG TPA: DUF1549 and DUF1553 domain-containing protein, partial [Blastocatellia bacterium]|nr:DUF1549 and DUF1553 domain-containing protein [Blastocatellia bacterium]